jgi:putative transposase
MQGIARLRRRSVGRRAAPRLGIIDTQVVKCISVRGPRGYDAGKGVWGRKRVALVDAAGLAVAVVPAAAQSLSPRRR